MKQLVTDVNNTKIVFKEFLLAFITVFILLVTIATVLSIIIF